MNGFQAIPTVVNQAQQHQAARATGTNNTASSREPAPPSSREFTKQEQTKIAEQLALSLGPEYIANRHLHPHSIIHTHIQYMTGVDLEEQKYHIWRDGRAKHSQTKCLDSMVCVLTRALLLIYRLELASHILHDRLLRHQQWKNLSWSFVHCPRDSERWNIPYAHYQYSNTL